MDKETIVSYLREVRAFILEGKFISAYHELKKVIDNLDADIKKVRDESPAENALRRCDKIADSLKQVKEVKNG